MTPSGWVRPRALQFLLAGADPLGVIAETITVHAAARSRAQGATVALWHAVEVHRSPAELDGACELTVCGTLARLDTAQAWPASGSDVCPTCRVLAR